MNKIFITIVLLSKVLTFEIANTDEKKQIGLMHRKSWDNIDGMIFINEEPSFVSYWMKDTYLDLTMLFCDEKLNILEIYYPEPLSTKPIFSKSDKVKYVIELKKELTDFIIKNQKQFKNKLLKELNKY